MKFFPKCSRCKDTFKEEMHDYLFLQKLSFGELLNCLKDGNICQITGNKIVTILIERLRDYAIKE